MTIKPSPRFVLLLLYIQATVGIVVYLPAIPLPAGLALLLLITLSLFYHLARHIFLLLSNSWREVTLDPGRQSVVTRDGSSSLFRIANKTIVSPHFVVLRVSLEGHPLPD